MRTIRVQEGGGSITGRGARLGILIKGSEVLESTCRTDTVVLDKTGTVTTGKMSLLSVHTAEGVEESQALRLAGAPEHAPEHPIAHAITIAAQQRLGELPAVEDLRGHHQRHSGEGHR
ncbi:hypothetical protein GCM10010191_49290 [Actinomadura vinacea]|uniref:HAD family hydrolase n=1 Tax=Actinomadura vinacea TaxID=115336 RepID=A0ABN3JJL4_9ACTN